MWGYFGGEGFCWGLGEVAKGTARRLNPMQESLNLYKAFKGRSELILMFHDKICLQNQAERHHPSGLD